MEDSAVEFVDSVLTVSELNRSARDLLEHGLSLSWVAGEISNFVQAASGHCYFSLKDEAAQVRCVMFRHRFQYLDIKPENGMKVEVRAIVTLYEAKGEFQLSVETMRVSGLGALYEAFQKLRAKLEKDGLFAVDRKRPLPSFPKYVGVITSAKAAALRDVLTTLRRRMPSISVILYPTPVQGEGAGEKIANTINIASRRAECDVIILCRGGGSIEDLWAFNEEVVARAIYASKIPIICGVGHETDFTIADFVADVRAPTPTAAAEIASPDGAELGTKLFSQYSRLKHNLTRQLERYMQQMDYLGKRLLSPTEHIRSRRQHFDHLRVRMQCAWVRHAEANIWSMNSLRASLIRSKMNTQALMNLQGQVAKRMSLAGMRYFVPLFTNIIGLQKRLENLNPQIVLERGYSIARLKDGAIVRNSNQIAVGKELDLSFAVGNASVIVNKKK